MAVERAIEMRNGILYPSRSLPRLMAHLYDRKIDNKTVARKNGDDYSPGLASQPTSLQIKDMQEASYEKQVLLENLAKRAEKYNRRPK